MNFPMTEPIFQFFYWLVNSAGLGGVVLLLLIPGTALGAFLTLRWISQGSQAKETDTYSFPTPSFHHSDDSDT